ncbi:MAG: hypothetical protein R3E32_14630 [Chitinophagales bacterium]
MFQKIILQPLAIFSMFVFLFICWAATCHAQTYISDIKTCTQSIDKQCLNDQTNFHTTSPMLYASCKIHNADLSTIIQFSWYYTSGDRILIDQVNINLSDIGVGTFHNLQSHLSKPNNDWPIGNYEVVIQTNLKNLLPVTKKFEIVAKETIQNTAPTRTAIKTPLPSPSTTTSSASAKISNLSMCENLNGQGLCNQDHPILAASAPTFNVSCQLHDVPNTTQVSFSWYGFFNGERYLIDIAKVNLANLDTADTYDLHSNLTRSNDVWPVGQYEIVVESNHPSIPVSRKQFSVQ